MIFLKIAFSQGKQNAGGPARQARGLWRKQCSRVADSRSAWNRRDWGHL